MPPNTAAWITAPNSTPLEVKEAPYPTPAPHEVVVKASYVAINPLEFKIQDYNPPIAGKAVQYPTILGADLSGTIVEVGDGVKGYEVGDRVIANAVGAATGKPAMSAFQLYVLLSVASLTKLPLNVSLEEGAVLPLACDTAMAGLFTPGQLGLSTANFSSTSREEQEGVLLVWGGSSSVGASAIQLAVAAGYKVYTTASARNHSLCQSLGAAQTFDYSHPNIQSQIIASLQGHKSVGVLDCVSSADSTITPCNNILAAVGGGKIITVLTPPEGKVWAEGVEVQRLSIPALRQSPAYDIVHGWMPRGLAEGKLKPKPDPYVVGEGLEYVQQGLDMVRKGVSAMKVVVKLS